MPRKARLDAPGVLQHVIARGIERRPIFSCDEDYEFLLKRLGHLLEEADIECFAWVLIPNHFHLLLRTGSVSLATFMRRLLTAYGVRYNRRYARSGHLFQNRYKSIVCEADPYLMELVRYIHLNPIRAGLVKNMGELERYRWCGDGVLMGKAQNSWQKTEEVLAYFGSRVRTARLKYRRFMAEGIRHGRRPELVGEVLSVRRDTDGAEEYKDSRVLGGSDFTKQVLSRKRGHGKTREIRRMSWAVLLGKIAEQWGLSPEDLLSGSKERSVVRVRSVLSYIAVRKMGMRASQVAEWLKVSQPAVSKSLLRGQRLVKENPAFMEVLQ